MSYKSKKSLSEKEIELIKQFAKLPIEEIYRLAVIVIVAKEITEFVKKLEEANK